ncbi:MAG TPA: UDP-glucose/GDP-mannose dehydrogenase family protein [Anaerolineae bacterium]|nr:UDP-glucose/GDP-mannose dehydrogenase family protein [Anaerolineae bacterium]HMR64043.1 UDP-glucose/GDP-mannose dehydrogenase family protein [Anaerolineae bacterium]
MNIAIFGLGYVGTVTAACLAEMGHTVVGVDVNPLKVDLINQGRSPVVEAGLDELVKDSVRQGHLKATLEAAEALPGADVSLICVGTPDQGNGSPVLTSVQRACADIGHQLAAHEKFHVVIVRSTVLPGTVDSLVRPTLEQTSGRKAGQDFGISFNPEFLREGSSIYDFHHPPYTLIGAEDVRSFDIAAGLYHPINAPIYQTSINIAEMVKFACNTFHALKITFANEIGNICKKQNIDSHAVMDMVCRDHKLNISPAYLKPGFAFGGSCLPKDLRALLYLGRHLDMRLPLLESILPSNELQIRHGLEMIAQTGKKKIGVLGFSFKAGTDDLRYSPQVELIERLIGKGYQVKLFDQNVSLARLHGANKAYIEREIPHLATLMCASIEEVLTASEVIVIGNKNEAFAQVLDQITPDQIVIDLVRISQAQTSDEHYQGICW